MKRVHTTGKNAHLSIPPGSKRWIQRHFTAANGQSFVVFVVSVRVVRGTKPGPVLASVAGQHGMEHTGPVVLRDFFEELDPAAIAGTVLVCPCANPMALAYDFEVFPEREKLPEPGAQCLTWQMFVIRERDDFGEYNMNRCWSDDISQPASPEAGEGVAARIVRRHGCLRPRPANQQGS
ncbi:MAG: succinylglutamate desuccinylase/aspartoacylase family protein [Verrucomicrobia bacterium]|nr:succinylglutamate desuccinylase/aspartoacylase family protein [Verrucomicrobiota bacterium]